MVKIEGKSVFGGVAIGPIGILKKKDKKSSVVMWSRQKRK